MSHNPAPPDAPFTALRDHAVLTLDGRDAAAFAHAQFMNDVAALAPAHWQWNGWLTPKGRVIALFALLKFDDARVWMLLQDVDADALAVRLRRFVFRSRVAIAVATQLHVGGALQASRWASDSHFVGDGDSAIELDVSADGGGRSIRLAPQSEFA
ncbi:MAG: folate-binding protein, partial [Luteimonas sp.]